MKQYNVNGQNYLAENLATGENGEKELEQALLINGNVTKNDVANYMKAKNLDELKDISFGGAGVAYSEVGLDTDIEMAIQVAGLVMAQAEKVAVKKVINQEFDAGLGKM